MMIAAVLLPFRDPVRLAEEMNVLDIVSKGRVAYVLAVGYRPEEFEHFGVDLRRRGRTADEKLELLLRIRSGEPVVHDGRRIHVTPAPYTPGGPTIMWGGGSIAAAERPAATASDCRRTAASRVCARRTRRPHASPAEPGYIGLPDRNEPSVVFVADDVDRRGTRSARHLLHDARMYSSWNEGDETTAMISHASTIEELRASSTGYRVMSVAEATGYVSGGGILRLAPLCGGIRPAIAWPYLERAAAITAA